MDFGYASSQQALRQEVRDFIAENMTQDVVEEVHGRGEDGRGPLMNDLFKKIGERGWLGISWPKEYGGQGGDRLTQYLVEEEFARVGLSVGGGGSGAPAIMAAGTQEQKDYYIPRIIKGEISFAQGFTEPSGGADLASLQCRAVEDGDEFVINGQKIYTSSAHVSTHLYLMARTDPEAPKHRGISIFLLPMDTPGITVRPLWTIQNDPPAPEGTTYGTPRTNETFYENVRIPKSSLLGELNMGWYVGAMGLNLDRVGASRYLISVRRDEDIVNLAKSDSSEYLNIRNNPTVRDKVAEMWIEAQVCRLMTWRSMSIVESGGNFTYEGSAEKVWAPEHGLRATEAYAQMLGPYGQLLNTSANNVESGLFAHNLLGAFQSGINHGSVQIMRDQVARRGLGLPRG
ncbi:MAG: acyl-CoA dehydrogenase family protein [Dehalococcoidia bacterium]|jgi:alkylation response protein AidB-like acyl-CoA dehydrogenase|nr:acyl-CoA dehydrogenase family protein [Dehalococcoidia bacterium]|tara:strand:- start:1650 stop:2852 length:1203 start_codon:yes stop_codon:yes gene_type:complete